MSIDDKENEEDRKILLQIIDRYENKEFHFSRAFRIIDNIDLLNGVELTDNQLITIGKAIKAMLDAPTINSINKENLRNVIRFLWAYVFIYEVDNET